ncbi:MAG: carbohydrate kinase [Alphaproteobacteria bacterium]|nr:MAG: carbohydrate kinase [Alphaproteobacteria bacterium]
MLLCCGEALIDMLPGRTDAGEDAFVPHAGGAVFNTAIALGRLGASAAMVTGLSNDLFGQRLEASLAASGVDATLAVRSDRPTTLAFVTLKGGQASYTFYDENTAGRCLRPEDMPDVPETTRAAFFGGISLAVEPCADAYAALAGRAASRAVVMLDPNIRPSFIGDEARYRGRLAAMLSHADIVKVSDEDLAWLVPEPADVRAQAGRLLAAGPAIVIVTRGGKGATAFTDRGEVVEVPAERSTVVDTIGAGDSFNAGFLCRLDSAGLLEKDTVRGLSVDALTAAMTFAARVAAVTVSRAGANPPWAHELAVS